MTVLPALRSGHRFWGLGVVRGSGSPSAGLRRHPIRTSIAAPRRVTMSVGGFAVVFIAMSIAGCSRGGDPDSGNSKAPIQRSAADRPPSRAVLEFPMDVRAEDGTVNTFLETALETAANSDYAKFRLLWTAASDPVERGQFEKGWGSLRKLRVEVLQKIRDPADQSIFYGMYVTAELDPEQIPDSERTERRMVLELRRENGQWRLANAGADVRDAMLELYKVRSGVSGNSDGGEPGASEIRPFEGRLHPSRDPGREGSSDVTKDSGGQDDGGTRGGGGEPPAP